MELFKVTDGEDEAGIFLKEENAQEKADRLNKFTKHHNSLPKTIKDKNFIKSDEYYVEKTHTED